MPDPPSRRTFVRRALAASAGAAAAPLAQPALAGSAPKPMTPSFVDLRRPPDAVTVFAEGGVQELRAGAGGAWSGTGVELTTAPESGGLRVGLDAPGAAVQRVRLRWRGRLDGVRQLMGDAWERAYGDLEWRGFQPARPMPWYFSTWDGRAAHCYGVRTAPAAFCFWQADPEGITLWLDVRSGGVGLQLGGRVLDVCRVICRRGSEGESAFAALRAFCREMCPNPRFPAQPVYGHNDWYYCYGDNSAQQTLRDAHRTVALSPAGANRPWVVIDAGWQPEGGTGGGVWDRGNEKFPDIPGLVQSVRQAGARAGIWIRPLEASRDTPNAWRQPRDRNFIDPTVRDALHKVSEDIQRLRQWGFELIKHDFSTDDICGRWGFEMGPSPTRDGWSFAGGRGRTTAEVILDLYRTIRDAAADGLVLGCNTVSHLSAGVFDLCRIGDDTSGRDWARTRRMGVNCLGFRAVQHGAFYAADPDCVGVTRAIPWEMNRQWLDLAARSGAVLFTSLAPDAVGLQQEHDLRAAFATASTPQPLGEPLDWHTTIWPARWRLGGREARYNWIEPGGASPFDLG